MVWMNNQQADASAELDAVKTIHTVNPAIVLEHLKKFLSENLPADELPDLLLTGENGDEDMDCLIMRSLNHILQHPFQ